MSADVLYACLYLPHGKDQSDPPALAALAQNFSPRFEVHRGDLVTIDVSGLGRLLGPPQAIGAELQRAAAQRGVRAHIVIASTRIAALVVARARPGLRVISRGGEADALAPLPVAILETLNSPLSILNAERSPLSVETLKRWGIKTLGALAAIPAADLSARLGQPGLVWQAIARGEDLRPLVPTIEAERFESSLELEWPIEGLEPLSFVLTRLLEPLSTRLERRDRGAAVLHVVLHLVNGEPVLRSLQLPAPVRDVRTLRTLALLDLESHPPAAAIDRVQIVIDPTPGRVLQHTFFTRAQPTPEQLSTLLARLGALMGQDRIGAAATVDSYRPGAFEMKPFAADHNDQRRERKERRENMPNTSAGSAGSALNVVTALRRCRQPVPARVAVADGRPARVTTDRRGFAGGAVLQCAGPWRTSGEWWNTDLSSKSQVPSLKSDRPTVSQTSALRLQSCGAWSRDEWDVALGDGTVYRIFRERETQAWFIDAIVD